MLKEEGKKADLSRRRNLILKAMKSLKKLPNQVTQPHMPVLRACLVQSVTVT
jgi:hypothetical protein